MEIIKPGKIRKIKLKCDECGCEFTCNLGELTRIYGTLWAECPQEGCHNVVEVPNGTPEYIAPAKQDNAAGTVAADLPNRRLWGAISYTLHTGKLYKQE